MKRRRLVLNPPLLPTITETLEDLPTHPSASQSSQSQEDYMSSIQALARPVETPSCGPVRLQRSPRLRHLSKAQMKLSASASLPRGSPRTLRTSRPYSLSSTEDFTLKMGKDPVDWLFGQIRTWRESLLLGEALGAFDGVSLHQNMTGRTNSGCGWCSRWRDLLWWRTEDLFIFPHWGLSVHVFTLFNIF